GTRTRRSRSGSVHRTLPPRPPAMMLRDRRIRDHGVSGQRPYALVRGLADLEGLHLDDRALVVLLDRDRARGEAPLVVEEIGDQGPAHADLDARAVLPVRAAGLEIEP